VNCNISEDFQGSQFFARPNALKYIIFIVPDTKLLVCELSLSLQ